MDLTRSHARILTVGLVAVLFPALVALARSDPSPDSAQHSDTLASAAAPSTSAGGEARDYLAEVRANFTPENRRYASIRATLGFVGPLLDIGVGLLFLFTGLSARMRDIAYARFKGRYGRILVYFVLFTLASFIVEFPLSWYSGFALEHQFGLSNQTFAAWLGDQGKDLLVSLFFLGAVGLVSLAYMAIERSPRRWWLWVGLGTIPVIVIGVLITPLVIDPLYNKFVPLRDQHLKQEILALAAKAEIPGRNVYEVDKSKQTNHKSPAGKIRVLTERRHQRHHIRMRAVENAVGKTGRVAKHHHAPASPVLFSRQHHVAEPLAGVVFLIAHHRATFGFIVAGVAWVAPTPASNQEGPSRQTHFDRRADHDAKLVAVVANAHRRRVSQRLV